MLEKVFSLWDKKVLNIGPCRFRPEDRLEVEVHYPFVGLLRPEEKRRFYRRLCKLMRSINLVAKGDVALSREERILIAVPAVILTFGFRYFHWGKFKHLFVYPKAYRSRLTGMQHYGETHPMGVIVLTLRRLKHGIDDPDDALHLLYHEYAHALVISRSHGNHTEDRRFLKGYQEMSKRFSSSDEIRNSEIIREYAMTNPMEFFAVTVEVLMEKADELKLHHPELYDLMIKALHLEPWEEALLKQATWYR